MKGDPSMAEVPGYRHEDGTVCWTASRTGPADPVCTCCPDDCPETHLITAQPVIPAKNDAAVALNGRSESISAGQRVADCPLTGVRR